VTISDDETNVTDDPGVKQCIFRRGVKYPERVRNATKASTSLMFCGSASGVVLRLYVDQQKSLLYAHSAPFFLQNNIL